MKKLKLYNAIINITWYGLLALTVLLVLLLLFGYSSIDQFHLFGMDIDKNEPQLAFLIPFTFGVWAVMLYAFFLFKKVINNFKERQFFTIYNITHLKKIGLILISLSVISALVGRTASFMHYNHIDLTGQTLYPVLLGFFFIVLSEVFKVAKNTKEEHDLTV